MVIDGINLLLVRKYDKPVPRYTSYPTIPNWKEKLDRDLWKSLFSARFDEENHVNGISIYIHLPFCESLCTYCGCNKKITTNHSVESIYLEAIQKEWQLYRKLMRQTPVIRELHLGGGTPTFFSPENLGKLVGFILKGSIIHPGREFSIEGHPNNTTTAHLEVLARLGFKRISFGVQDNDPKVQYLINRIQPFENVKTVIEKARHYGFRSVNFDLIYGLPAQTQQSISRTIQQVIDLRPDRIAFYSYAHVPWVSKGQRLFDESNLPSAEEKVQLYLTGKQLLTAAGYVDIGMDHFALTTDDLYKARTEGTLHRNFMGYTTLRSGLLLGLGVSSISDIGTAYAQNDKNLHDYYSAVNKGEIPTRKGLVLETQDLRIKKYILDISCRGETEISEEDMHILENHTLPELKELEKDGLITMKGNNLTVTSQGHSFIRNICAAFDQYLNDTDNNKLVFSKAI